MEFHSDIPLYLQVIADIKKQIITGQLELGSRLPSTRELAARYQINLNTAVRVYNEMEQQHITFTKRGIGTFVTKDPQKRIQLKNELAGILIGRLVKELKDIGFDREELLDTVSHAYDQIY